MPISRVAALYDDLVAAATLIAAELAESEEADPDLDEDGSYDYE